MRSAIFRPSCKPSCCAFCRSASSSGWARETDRCRCSDHRRHQSRSRRRGAERPVSRRSFLPAQCRAHCPGAAAPAAPRHRDSVVPLPQTLRRGNQKHFDGVEPEAMDKLIVYDWPGNVRELANVERALVFGDGPKLVAGDLPMKITASASATATAVSPISGRSMTTAGI